LKPAQINRGRARAHAETDPLDAGAEGDSGINLQGVIELEDLTLKSPPLVGVVLRLVV
jgi:hypothetical protein